ncbi:MAG: ParA family protein [Aphanocapsa sp. GSE-SYN-MK-11-07L]|jgi:chromosome partitioning protein|nr:ParA family protein [Aphanocapsa sp. GSE-SYN-MK-11-07L]
MTVAVLDTPPVSHPLKQVVLWIGANSGGVSKTTLAIHIAYVMACRGAKVAVLDLDTNVSMSQFTGLDKSPVAGETLAYVLSEHFDGDWPFASPDWGEIKGRIDICRGGPVMAEAGIELANRKRREYLLSDRLSDFPLPHDLVILDCPATLSNLSDVALVASTHLLIPLEPTPKSLSGCDVLLKWYQVSCRALRLNPQPEILGVVPVRYDANSATQREYRAKLPEVLNGFGIHCYPSVRFSQEYINASARGLPLQLHRRHHKACGDFLPICETLSELLEN